MASTMEQMAGSSESGAPYLPSSLEVASLTWASASAMGAYIEACMASAALACTSATLAVVSAAVWMGICQQKPGARMMLAQPATALPRNTELTVMLLTAVLMAAASPSRPAVFRA